MTLLFISLDIAMRKSIYINGKNGQEGMCFLNSSKINMDIYLYTGCLMVAYEYLNIYFQDSNFYGAFLLKSDLNLFSLPLPYQ